MLDNISKFLPFSLTTSILALQYGSSSGDASPPSSNISNTSATISISPHSPSSSCAPCLVFASEGGANILSKVIWYETPVPVTLDTVSIVLSQYNNATITSSTTIYGDIRKLNGSQVPAEASLQRHFSQLAETNAAMELQNYYASMGSFVLANGTDGGVDGGVTSFAYPTPYVGINGFILFTSLTRGGSSAECLVSTASDECAVQGVTIDVPSLGSTTISLKTTYYSPIPSMVPTGTDIASILESFFENVGIDTSSFSEFLQSNTELVSSFPMLASCYYQHYGFGPPAVKIPATALTATVTTTTSINGNPPGVPSPANPIRPPIAPHTTSQPHPLPNQETPSSSTFAPLPFQGDEHTNQGSPNLPAQTQASDDSSAPQDKVSPVKSSPNSPAVQNQDLSLETNAAAPIVSFAGSEIRPDESNRYDFPGIGTIQPGGSPVTKNSVVFSLLPCATAVISNGAIIPITPVAIQPVTSPKPYILAFGSSSFTADSLSNFIIDSQTLIPSSPSITVFGTPVSLAPGGSVAVIGSSTTRLDQGDVPTIVPVLTLNGAAFTATSSAAFVIAGQTLTPGGSITISGTPVIYPSTGNAVIVGTSTQEFSSATIAASFSSIFTFAGQIYTADNSMDFEIGDQTLTKGGSITISGTPISYASGGGDVVVGTETEALGSVIANGFGNGLATASSTVAVSAGGAQSWRRASWKIAGATAGVVGLLIR